MRFALFVLIAALALSSATLLDAHQGGGGGRRTETTTTTRRTTTTNYGGHQAQPQSHQHVTQREDTRTQTESRNNDERTNTNGRTTAPAAYHPEGNHEAHSFGGNDHEALPAGHVQRNGYSAGPRTIVYHNTQVNIYSYHVTAAPRFQRRINAEELSHFGDHNNGPIIEFGHERFNNPDRFSNRAFFPAYYHMEFGYWGHVTTWQPSLWTQLTWSAFPVWDPLYWGRFDVETEINMSPYFVFGGDDDRAAFYDHWYYSYLLANPNIEWNPAQRYAWILDQIQRTQHSLNKWINEVDYWRNRHYTHKLEQLEALKGQMELEYPFLVGGGGVIMDAAAADDVVVEPKEHEKSEEHEHEKSQRHRRGHKGGSKVHVEVLVD